MSGLGLIVPGSSPLALAEAALLAPNVVTGGINWISQTLIAATATFAFTAGELRVMPTLVPRTLTFDLAAVDVTVGAASTFVRIVIYNDTGSGYPKDLIFDSGQIDAAVAAIKTVAFTQTLQPGIYWTGAVNQGGTPTLRYNNNPVGQPPMPAGTTATWVPTGTQTIAWSVNGVVGAPPSTWGARVSIGGGPRIGLRVA